MSTSKAYMIFKVDQHDERQGWEKDPDANYWDAIPLLFSTKEKAEKWIEYRHEWLKVSESKRFEEAHKVWEQDVLEHKILVDAGLRNEEWQEGDRWWIDDEPTKDAYIYDRYTYEIQEVNVD